MTATDGLNVAQTISASKPACLFCSKQVHFKVKQDIKLEKYF